MPTRECHPVASVDFAYLFTYFHFNDHFSDGLASSFSVFPLLVQEENCWGSAAQVFVGQMLFQSSYQQCQSVRALKETENSAMGENHPGCFHSAVDSLPLLNFYSCITQEK